MEKTGERLLVVDSSVVTKWFLVEEGSDLAAEVRNGFATRRLGLAVPTLLFYEVLNALRFSGAFGEADLAKAARSLSKYRFEVWRPMGALLGDAGRVALREGITVYDAFYVALAQRKGSKLLTEDGELLEKFPALTLSLRRFGAGSRK